MIRRHLGRTAVWAAGTFGLALALGLPAISNAVDDANAPEMVATILTPHITTDGVELTVVSDGAATQPSEAGDSSGNHPMKFEVRAVNKTSAAVSGKFTVRMTSVMPFSRGSRTLPMATEVWKDSGEYSLDAGESKTFTFTTSALEAKRMFTVTMDSQDSHVAILSMVEASR